MGKLYRSRAETTSTNIHSHERIYYIKMKCCLSVGTFWHACNFTVSPRIDARFARNEVSILREH